MIFMPRLWRHLTNWNIQMPLLYGVQMTDNFPEHTLLSNAFFWQGEAHYQMQDFDNAIVKYNRVIEQYNESSKYPAALLKAGLSCFALYKIRKVSLG
jgi:TolA-binding protein